MLVLLALLTGAPDLAPGLFSHLRHGATGETLAEVLDGIAAQDETPAFRGHPDWPRVETSLKALAGMDGPPLRLDRLHDHADEVARFSFFSLRG